MKERTRVTRKEAREYLQQLNLACELAKLIRHFFLDLIPLLRELPDLRHQSYVPYPSIVLLMTRILSSIFYISSMRKTSEEFNSDTMIENIRLLYTAPVYLQTNGVGLILAGVCEHFPHDLPVFLLR